MKKTSSSIAPFGIVGLETAVPLSIDRLVHAGLIRLPRLVELLSVNPARILRVPGGSLSEGAPADITIIAPELRVRVQASAMRSRSKNTRSTAGSCVVALRRRSLAAGRCS